MEVTWTVENLTNAPATLRINDVAEILGVSKPTALKAVHSKGFPILHCGKRIIIPTKPFLEWLNAAGDRSENDY